MDVSCPQASKVIKKLFKRRTERERFSVELDAQSDEPDWTVAVLK